MKINETPINGIYKAKVLCVKVLPDRDPDAKDVKYGFNCTVAIYGRNGEFLGVAVGGGAHNRPLSAASPAIRFLRALQDIDAKKICNLKRTKGAYLLVEVETKIIPAMGTRKIIREFISRRKMSLSDWESEAGRKNDSGKCPSRL
jgi:hypothetical protein